MDNHLIIALGGTGGKMLRSLRRTIYQNLRREEPPTVNIRYLYVDSEDSMMGIEDESWKILGRSVQLSAGSQLLIAGMGLGSVIDNISSYPGIKPWIGDRRQWQGILNSAKGAQIAGGQKRRLGRFLFANKVTQFKNQVDLLVRDMTDRGQTGVTFHVCCGLAGGTGSGTLIDAVCQLRAAYPTRDDRIFVYALLPERQPNPTWAGSNYHANGYAALQELNAIAVGAWHPHDVSGERRVQTGSGEEAAPLKVHDPFNACYLFTDENAAGYRVPVERGLSEVVAAFLYSKVVTGADIGDLGDIRRQESFEMHGGARGVEGEREFEEGPPTRSGRFFTFGIKQLAYPEEEILEYLTYAFAEQAALQLRFNNWSEGLGYTDSPRIQSFDTYVRSRDTQNAWRITDGHLTLSEGILQDERENARWKPLEADWANAAANFLTFVQEEKNKEQWLDRLTQLFEKRFDTEFRGQGVPTFYTKRKELQGRYVQEIRGLVENQLFEAWLTGTQSMQELSQVLIDLRQELDERRLGMERHVTQHNDIAQAYLERARAADVEYAKINLLTGFLSKHERLLKAKSVNLEQYYLARTRALAFAFAKSLLASLVNELDSLRVEADRAASTLVQAVDRFRDEIASRISDGGQDDLRQQTIRFYDPSAVKALSERLVKDAAVQQPQAASIRQGIAELIGPYPSFAKLNQQVSLGSLLDLLQKRGADNVQAAHDVVRAQGGSPLLKVSIIDRLYEKFGADEDRLRVYVDRVVKQAQTFARFSNEEIGSDVPGRCEAFTTFTFILPATMEHPDFTERLERALRAAVPTGASSQVLRSPRRQNEIVILNVASSFPVRFLESAKLLREKYDRLRHDQPERAAFELHLEGDGSHLPSLYQPRVNETPVRPFLLLAQALGLFSAAEDRAGRPSLVYEILDDDGLPVNTVQLGSSLIDAQERVDLKLVATIRQAVETRLSRPEFDGADARRMVFGRVVEETKKIKTVARDGEYEAFADGARAAKRLLQLT